MIKHFTIGVRTDVDPPGSWVSMKLTSDDTGVIRSHHTYLTGDQALDLAARLIQAVTALAPIDLAGIVKEATSG